MIASVIERNRVALVIACCVRTFGPTRRGAVWQILTCGAFPLACTPQKCENR